MTEKPKVQAAPVTRQDREEAKQRKRDIRKLERELENIMTELDRLDGECAELNEAMSDPANYSDGAKIKQLKEELAAAEEKRDAATLRWEEIEEALAGLKEQQ